jgi:hypothetical protein
MKQDIYGSYFLLILRYEYLKQSTLKAGKENICVKRNNQQVHIQICTYIIL